MQAYKLKGKIAQTGHLIITEPIEMSPGEVEIIILQSVAEVEDTKEATGESKPEIPKKRPSKIKAFQGLFENTEPAPPDFDSDQARWEALKEKVRFVKVLLDTNIIVDVALERQPYLVESEQVLLLVEQERVEGYISASTFSDLYYIIRKSKGREWTINFLRRLFTFCQIATVDRSVIAMALTTNFKDFEDAIQYNTAVVNQLDAITTRNPQDFPITTPRIITQECVDSGIDQSSLIHEIY